MAFANGLPYDPRFPMMRPIPVPTTAIPGVPPGMPPVLPTGWGSFGRPPPPAPAMIPPPAQGQPMPPPAPMMQPAAPQQDGLGGGLQNIMQRVTQGLQNNPNASAMLAAGLLDKRRNANIPLSAVMRETMEAGSVDTYNKEKKEEKEGETKKQNATVRWLVKYRGMTEEEAQTVVDAGVVSDAIKGDEFMDVGGVLFNKTQGTWVGGPPEGMGTNNDVFGTPIYGVTGTGERALGVIGKNGKFRPVDTGGFKLSGDIEKLDLGPSWGIYDNRLGRITEIIPKDVEAEATQKARGAASGEAEGKAQGALPAIETNARFMTSSIDALLADPSLASVTGSWQGALPAVTGGQSRAQSRIDQVLGQAFLQAFETIKGAGSISEQEGAAATNAMTRLRTQRMGDEDYRAAVEDLRTKIEDLVALARKRAGQEPVEPGGEDLYDKYGLERP